MYPIKKVIVFSHYQSGGGKPLDSFWFSQEACLKNGVETQICWTKNFRSGLKAILKSKRVVFDGKYSAYHFYGPVLLLIALLCSKRIAVYWHETEWNLSNQYPFDLKIHPRLSSFLRHPLYYARNLPIRILMRSTRVAHFHVCQYGVDMLANKFGIPRENIYLLNNITASERLLRHDLPRKSEPYLYVTCSKVSKRKRPDLFLKVAQHVCSQYKQARFIWIGRMVDYTEEQLQGEIRKLGLDGRVGFVGQKEDPTEIMSSANVVIHTAEDDPMPKVLMEALGVGKKVIAFDVGGISELLGDLGAIVPFCDTDAMAQLAIEAVQCDTPSDQLRRRQRYLENFTPDSFGKRFVAAVDWWDNRSVREEN